MALLLDYEPLDGPSFEPLLPGPRLTHHPQVEERRLHFASDENQTGQTDNQ